MAVARAFLLAMVFGTACARESAPPAGAEWAEARRELETRGAADQAVREGFGVGGSVDTAQVQEMLRIDSANTAWLKAHVAERGWPTVSQVGRDAVQAAFLIVQHATQDTAFMRKMLPAITESARRGDLDGGDVAMLTDRLEVKAGRPQIYGTQLSLRDGRWVLDPIADSANVDARRAAMGLMPLAEYVRKVDSVMRGP
jgi:hypothetical protein